MKYLFFAIGAILLLFGLYLMFGGQYMRSDKTFFLCFLMGICTYCTGFVFDMRGQVSYSKAGALRLKTMKRNMWYVISITFVLSIIALLKLP